MPTYDLSVPKTEADQWSVCFSLGWEPLTTSVNEDMGSGVQCGACHWMSEKRVQLPECLG